jgi:hypothetical protein
MKKSISPRCKRHRPIWIERLEDRQLLAGDIYHNFTIPEDSDGNGSIDPLDALVIVNQLNGGATSRVSTPDRSPQLLDVDGDRSLTPLDALMVINHLNLSNGDVTGSMRASRVNVERRIERIEWSIANDTLPPNMTIENAQNILDTLRLGGRPELGDRIVDGFLDWNGNAIPETNTSGREYFIRVLEERLSAFGVPQSLIETIRVEIAAARESGESMATPAIRERLAELGVDVESILPQRNRLDSTNRQLHQSMQEVSLNLLSEQQRENLAQLRSDLESVIANSEVTSEMIQQLAESLSAVMDGATRPSEDSVAQLVNTIQSSLDDGSITLPEQMEIREDLIAVLESANIPISEINAVIDDLQAIRSASGITRETITTIVGDIRAIATEFQTNRPRRMR